MGKLLDAVKSKDRRRMLEALAEETAETIEDTASGRDMAALSKRLMEITAELETMPDPDAEIDPIDQMAALVAEYDEYEDPRFEDEDDEG